MLNELQSRLVTLGDQDAARKIKELQQKLMLNRLEIALCGHFSAGKSSLLNFLCEKSLLPTSPIPTSANLVRIAFGEPRIEVEMGEQHVRSTHPLNVALLDEWCRNGEDIRAIEIYDHIPYLQAGLGLLDTPGIDSTDPAHKRATEAALHLADVVFYVMDYNHVQSEWNFAFVKELQDRKKPVVLIVNQIDKHRAEELSFEDFRSATEASFRSWDIEPLAFIYVSVRVPSHPYSEWDRLRKLFQALKGDSGKLVQNNVVQSLQTICRTHVEQFDVERAALRATLEEEAQSEQAQIALGKQAELDEKLRQLQLALAEYRQNWKKESQATLDNANLTASIVRDELERLLDSLRTGFKLGLFSSAKKVEEERQNRLHRFIQLLDEHVQSQALVHLQKQLEQDAIFTGNATTVFQSPVTADWLIALIGEVQALNGEYVLNCSRKIAEAIRQQLRQQANRMLDECIVKREELLNVQRSEIEAERAVYANLLLSVERLRNLLDENEAHLQALTALIPFQYESVKLHLPEAVVLHTKTNASEQNDVQLSTSTNQQAWIEPELVQADRAAHTSLVENLQQLAVQIEEYPWLTSFRQELIERARRMNNQSYIFALFGAFSAGKSSFANALLGAPVLPVSPNPTTAAINKIVPVSDDHPHQNAYITMKTSEALFADVQFALRMLGYEPATFEAALHTIEQLKEADIVAKAKPHFSFLKAVERGLQETEALRGTRWLADFEQFKAYAASEWLSCFVEEIAFAYDCPLTAAGVRLVDTPGADSIHARHTGVAFKFIKEADALFFVTYYNHAFSHADKEFLQQLGRVKDQFALDKMFFVINAADLASDDAERQTVVDYVRGQLQVNGVREPRIFPLSSLYGLQAKLRKDASEYETSGFKQLEQALGTFIQQEMHTLTQNNALQLLQKLTVRLENWLTLQQQDAATFEAQRLSQLQAIATFESTDERKQVVAYGERLTREMNELLFHLKNRIQYRFGEWFIAAFHPSLWSTGSKDNGRILNQAWQEFIAQLSFAISQEMLANTLRIEREMQRMITQCAEQWMARVQQQMANFTFELPDWQQVPTPTVLERVESANIEPAYFTRYFKNPKSFFEGDGRNHLRADLEPKVTSLISQYVEWHVENWTTFYQEQLKAAFEPLLANYYAELEMAKVSLSQTQPTDTEKQVIEQVLTFVKKCGG